MIHLLNHVCCKNVSGNPCLPWCIKQIKFRDEQSVELTCPTQSKSYIWIELSQKISIRPLAVWIANWKFLNPRTHLDWGRNFLGFSFFSLWLPASYYTHNTLLLSLIPAEKQHTFTQIGTLSVAGESLALSIHLTSRSSRTCAVSLEVGIRTPKFTYILTSPTSRSSRTQSRRGFYSARYCSKAREVILRLHLSFLDAYLWSLSLAETVSGRGKIEIKKEETRREWRRREGWFGVGSVPSFKILKSTCAHP